MKKNLKFSLSSQINRHRGDKIRIQLQIRLVRLQKTCYVIEHHHQRHHPVHILERNARRNREEAKKENIVSSDNSSSESSSNGSDDDYTPPAKNSPAGQEKNHEDAVAAATICEISTEDGGQFSPLHTKSGNGKSSRSPQQGNGDHGGDQDNTETTVGVVEQVEATSNAEVRCTVDITRVNETDIPEHYQKYAKAKNRKWQEWCFVNTSNPPYISAER